MTDTKQSEHIDSDYMFSPVPTSARRSTWKQVLVWIGFGYVATGLFIGGTFAGLGGKGGLPFESVILAIVIGMGTLFLLTSALGIVAQRTGLSLSLVSRYSYGHHGAHLPMLSMGLLTLGWFSSITGMVGDIWGKFIGNPSGITVFDPAQYGLAGVPITLEVFLACVIFGLLFTYTALFGIKGLEMIAVPVSPIIMLLALFAGIFLVQDFGGWATFIEASNQHQDLSLSTAITMLIGSWIAGAVMGIDLFRFNKNITGVFLGAAACFILTNPLLNIVGYISMTTVQDANYITWMMEKGVILALIGVFTWTLSLWTTNDAELYCNANYIGPSLRAMGLNVTKKRLVLTAGITGTILGSIGFYQILFADFINYLGVMAPPLAGPILADYFLSKKRLYDLALLDCQPAFNIAGVVSAVIGMIAGLVMSITGVLAQWPTGMLALILTIVLYALLDGLLKTSKGTHYEESRS